MTINEMEHYLSECRIKLDKSVNNEIIRALKDAVTRSNEEEANYLWCLSTIFHIQEAYVEAFQNLQSKNYEEAWNLLDKTDCMLRTLYSQSEVNTSIFANKYHLEFIATMIPRYQKVFPYKYFLSRGAVIKEMHCSICGQSIKIRNRCKHKIGHLYMGRLCQRIITKMDIKEVSLVTNPTDKYAIVHIKGQEYNYSALELLMSKVASPYTEWDVVIST